MTSLPMACPLLRWGFTSDDRVCQWRREKEDDLWFPHVIDYWNKFEGHGFGITAGVESQKWVVLKWVATQRGKYKPVLGSVVGDALSPMIHCDV